MADNMNSGYSGWAMSNRAVAAYEDGEMPRSKWTKAAMLAAIKDALEELEIQLDEEQIKNISAMSREILFEKFFYNSSWHHTSKYANATDFFAVDEAALEEAASTRFQIVWHIQIIRGSHSFTRDFPSRRDMMAWLTRNDLAPVWKLEPGIKMWGRHGFNIRKWETIE